MKIAGRLVRNNMKIFYNDSRKLTFINYLIEKNKISYRMYNKIFFITAKFEDLFGKDVSCFASDELLMIYREIAEKVKYNTVATYNSLIGDYKEWCAEKNIESIPDICNAIELRTIKRYKQYTILNDSDMKELTGDSDTLVDIDGADYNAIIFMRLLWEIDARQKPEDILRIKIDDLDLIESTILINNTKYKISPYLAGLIYEFAELDYITFVGKNGRYAIYPAKNNAGYILRPARTKNTRIGEPFTVPRMSNFMFMYCKRHESIEPLSINDLLMSLALKHMLKFMKTHTEMYTERRYFANIPSSIYKSVFEKYAKEKFPELYKAYYAEFIGLKQKFQ